MRIALLLVSFLTASFFTLAQSYEIAKLRQQIQEHPQQDTFRIHRLNEICNVSPRISTDEMEKFSDEALLISRKLGYTVEEGYALVGKARAIYLAGNTEAGAALLQQADILAKKTGDRVLQLWVLLRLSNCYVSNDNKLSLSWALKAEELVLKLDNKTFLSKTYSIVGEVYYQLGDYAKGMEYQMKSLKAGEEANCLVCQRFTWLKIAVIYTDIGEYDKSIQYYQKAFEASKRLGFDEATIADIIGNIGGNYALMGKYAEALQQYKLSLKMCGSINPHINMIMESNIADVYVRTDSLQLAFQYAFNSLVAAKELHVIDGWIEGILSRAYLKMKMPDSALYYAKLGLAAAESADAIEYMRDNILALANAYAFKNDFKNAYEYHNLYISYRDSMLNNEIKNKTAVFEHNYEMEKKEGQILLLNHQKRSQQNYLIAISTVLFLILVTAVALLRNNRQKQKAKQKIEKAYGELKTTQAQLIQSEKMASLGELTAGIAHEIQNPLNFVNNFSEVNNELISELVDEVDKGNYEEVKLIAINLQDNEQKIIHHGKRADSIVKGMLEHSRTSTGKKEPTDINKLTDEYLRLSYHGLRAKDKSFNTEIRADFDETIGKINIIPQDIGRVLLNLYNNAFYAVNEKLKAESSKPNAEYKPLVLVQTKKINGRIEISVRDNGNGISQKIVDKIFQPFFTTKPTGQGTGLGLSLAYDIVKAHGGEIKVETKGNEGTEFIINLPIQSV